MKLAQNPKNIIFRRFKERISAVFTRHSKWLFLLLLFSLVMNLCGIHWGLPDYRGWAPDEVTPSYILNAIQHKFSNGWHELYPPLHFYILAVSYAPVYLLDLLKLIDFHKSVKSMDARVFEDNIMTLPIGNQLDIPLQNMTLAMHQPQDALAPLKLTGDNVIGKSCSALLEFVWGGEAFCQRGLSV